MNLPKNSSEYFVAQDVMITSLSSQGGYLKFLLLQYCSLSRVETIDGTATVDQDYLPINEIITFESGETEKFVSNYKIVFEVL